MSATSQILPRTVPLFLRTAMGQREHDDPDEDWRGKARAGLARPCCPLRALLGRGPRVRDSHRAVQIAARLEDKRHKLGRECASIDRTEEEHPAAMPPHDTLPLGRLGNSANARVWSPPAGEGAGSDAFFRRDYTVVESLSDAVLTRGEGTPQRSDAIATWGRFFELHVLAGESYNVG